MASFPTIRNGSVAMYGTVQTTQRKITKVEFENGSEQRYKTTRPLFMGRLEFSKLSGYDFSLVVEFFNSAKGQADKTWEITIDGNTWENMTFTQDALDYVSDGFNSHTFSLGCRQVRKN